MSFYMAQVIADERSATVARENSLSLAQSRRSPAEIPRARFSLARLFRRTKVRRASTTAIAPCPTAPGVAASGC